MHYDILLEYDERITDEFRYIAGLLFWRWLIRYDWDKYRYEWRSTVTPGEHWRKTLKSFAG